MESRHTEQLILTTEVSRQQAALIADVRTTTGQYFKKRTSASIANCYTQNSYCILYLNLIIQIINILEGNIDRRSSKMGQWVNAEDLSFSPEPM